MGMEEKMLLQQILNEIQFLKMDIQMIKQHVQNQQLKDTIEASKITVGYISPPVFADGYHQLCVHDWETFAHTTSPHIKCRKCNEVRHQQPVY